MSYVMCPLRASLLAAILRSNHQLRGTAAEDFGLVLQTCKTVRSTLPPTSTCLLLDRFLDHTADLRPDYRLSRTTIEALLRLLRREKTHGWGQDLEVLMRVIRFPLSAQLAEVGRGFQQLAGSPAFSNCVGAIDGCHIRIKAPHGRVLRNSPVFVSASYPPPGHFIVGDGGYPCIHAPITLITPYREPLRGPVEARFNARHAKARIVIERVFGMMKARWRGIFFKALKVNTIFVPKVVAVCTILHNLAVTNGDSLTQMKKIPAST
ncbi:hypothetical protein WMY93_033158 [Mugilogobius chulae]|uniref:DDE Tnp4 domain-containing protein n=1 Tax=Mugilogobius chulae TaxID=88201 RepID=A0AAW0MSQ2_9GOBI